MRRTFTQILLFISKIPDFYTQVPLFTSEAPFLQLKVSILFLKVPFLFIPSCLLFSRASFLFPGTFFYPTAPLFNSYFLPYNRSPHFKTRGNQFYFQKSLFCYNAPAYSFRFLFYSKMSIFMLRTQLYPRIFFYPRESPFFSRKALLSASQKRPSFKLENSSFIPERSLFDTTHLLFLSHASFIPKYPLFIFVVVSFLYPGIFFYLRAFFLLQRRSLFKIRGPQILFVTVSFL